MDRTRRNDIFSPRALLVFVVGVCLLFGSVFTPYVVNAETKKTTATDGKSLESLRDEQRRLRRERMEKDRANREAAVAKELAAEQQMSEEAHSNTPQPTVPIETPKLEQAPSPDSAETTKSKLDDELASSGAIDAILLLDSSGSMKRTDPSRLRDQGAKLFLRFLEPRDRVAIYQFDSEAKSVIPFSYANESQIPSLDKAISAVSNDGGFTDIEAAAKEAIDSLIKSGRPDAAKAVVVLSDGKMDPRPSKGTSFELTNRLFDVDLPLYKKRNVRLYSLSFGAEADKNLLEKMAQATGGEHWFASSVDGIHMSFSNLFLALKKPQVVTLEANGFEIDDRIDEATFYVTRKKEESGKVILSDPFGNQIRSENLPAGIKWYKAENFDIITVKKPVQGVWSIEGISVKEGFATLLTDIKLQVQWPEGDFKLGDKARLVARLSQEGKALTDARLKDVLFFTYKTINTETGNVVAQGELSDRGGAEDQVSNDLLFSAIQTLGEEGSYKSFVTVRAPTFTRQQVISFKVSREPITLSIKRLKDDATGIEQDYFSAATARGLSELKEKSVRLIAQKEGSGAELILDMKENPHQPLEYIIPTSALEVGNYRISAKIQGIDSVKGLFESFSGQLSFVVAAHQEQVKKEEPKKVELPPEPEEPAVVDVTPGLGIVLVLLGVIWVIGVTVFYLLKLKKEKSDSVVRLAEYVVPRDLEQALNRHKPKGEVSRRGATREEQEIFTALNNVKSLHINVADPVVAKEWTSGEEPPAKQETTSVVDSKEPEVSATSQKVDVPETAAESDVVEPVKEVAVPEEPVANAEETAASVAAEPEQEATKEEATKEMSKEEAEVLAAAMLEELGAETK